MKKISKIIYFITSAFMYTVLFLMLIVFITIGIYVLELTNEIKAGKNPTPIFSSYIIVSGSMVPNIKINDMIINQRVKAYELKVGDIITFVSEGKITEGLTITHRIIAITQNATGEYLFRTKGDANETADDWLVPEDNIIGKALIKIPFVGYIQSFITNFYGFVIIIITPFLLIVIYDIIKLSLKIVDTSKKHINKLNNKK